jgi:hypothetical protein
VGYYLRTGITSAAISPTHPAHAADHGQELKAGCKGRKGVVWEPLQCLCIKVELRTQTATSMMHGALTDLREAVAFLRKLADEIATELRREPSRTRTPAREPEPAPTRTRPCL